METISSLAHTAAKAVWGEGTEHDEPASGVQGDVSKGEPYDGGNIEPEDQKRRDSKFADDDEPLKETQIPQKYTERTESRPETSDRAIPDPEERTEPLGPTPETAESTTAKDPDSAPTEVGDKSGDKSGGMGAGPRPLATIAKEYGGDAGNRETSSEPPPADRQASGASEPNQGEDMERKGTGEQWVKTTGLAADGGDFDATKPGAGREADRLLEEMGVDHKVGVDHPKPDSSSSASGDKDGKPSLKERIKDKLHIHRS